MADYRKMYVALFSASEKAVDILIAAQKECEEMYLQDDSVCFRISPKGDQMDDAPCEKNS